MLFEAKKREKAHGHGQQCGDCGNRGRKVKGEVEEGTGGINGDENNIIHFY